MTTTFSKNVNLNLAFGNAQGSVVNPDFDKIRNQAKLVLEELRELLEAAYFDHDVVLELKLTPKTESAIVDVKDIMRGILDAQGDITTVNDGVAHISGFDGDECLQRVYASNMSKFIRTEAEVGPALDYYYSRGFPSGQLRVEGEFPQACIKVNETVTWNGKEYPAGKFLKNMAAFKEPDFEDMLTDKPTEQIKTVVTSLMTEVGALDVLAESGIVFVNPMTMAEITSRTFVQEVSEVRGEDGVLESYIPAYALDETNMPDFPAMWGDWVGNVRVYVASPIQSVVTELTRID